MKKEKAPEEALIEKQNKDSDFSQFLQAYNNLFHEIEDADRYEDVPNKYRHPVAWITERTQYSISGLGDGDARPTDRVCGELAEFILRYAVRYFPVFRFGDADTFFYRSHGEWERGTIDDLTNIVSSTARCLYFGGAYLYGKAPNIVASTIYKEMLKDDRYKYTSEKTPDEATESTEADFYNDKDYISESDVEDIEMFGKNGEIGAYPKQGLIGLIGSQKQGKSTECYAKALALINGEPFAGFTPSCTADRILLIDTEQTPATISRKLRVFRKQLKRPNEFQVLSVKSLPVLERLDKVKEKCELHNPQVVFIDGIVDMVNNFNDPEECKAFFERIGKLATDRLIVCLLHTNKTDKTSPRGHLGTILSQKAEETYQVKKENGVFRVYVVESRHADTTDAQPMTFAIDNNGFLIDEGTIIKEATEKERRGFYDNFVRIFGDDTELRHKDLITRLNDKDNLEKTAAGTKITKAVTLGVLKKTDPSNSHSPYVLVVPY